jgi:hypothetical protein
MTKQQSRVVTLGNADIVGGAVTHEPVRVGKLGEATSKVGETGEVKSAPRTIVRSNIEFEQGTIPWGPSSPSPAQVARFCWVRIRTQRKAAVRQGSPRKVCLPRPSCPQASTPGASHTGSRCCATRSWEAASAVGQGSAVPANGWLKLSFNVSGSIVDLYVEGIQRPL